MHPYLIIMEPENVFGWGGSEVDDAGQIKHAVLLDVDVRGPHDLSVRLWNLSPGF